MLTGILVYVYSGTDFKTPKIHRTVRASDLSYQSRGDYQADYLTVEHNTVVQLHDEFILVGRETDTGRVFAYTDVLYTFVMSGKEAVGFQNIFVICRDILRYLASRFRRLWGI